MFASLMSDTQTALSGHNIIYYFIYIVGGIILLLTIKKIYFYVRYRRRYFIFPKINTTGISNTAMVISISVTIILLLTVLSAGAMGIFFRVYPGWRVTIEGILIKIGGLLFGPILGLFIAALTDILTVALTAGMFHYGFFIVALAYGFFSGFICVIINYCKKNTTAFIFIVTILCVCVTTLISFYIMDSFDVYVLTLFNIEIKLQNWLLMTIFIGFNFIVTTALWGGLLIFQRELAYLFFINVLLFFTYKFKKLFYVKNLKLGHNCQRSSLKLLLLQIKIGKKYHGLLSLSKTLNDKIIKKKNLNYSWFDAFAPVVALIIIVEPIIEILMMPAFDQELGGGIPLDYWITYRIFFGIVVALVNLFVVLPIYKTIRQIIKYDYRSSIVESASKYLITS